ncbi:MAG: acetylornithine/succinylornithine family transaminase [Ruminococcaceae bacterium]|nr:acetylornithine/succinylornithine family transaminase [Oscillospiraceae bacterium]
MNIKELDKEYIAGTYGRFPLTLIKGKGSIAIGDDGSEYIDMATGIAVNTFGYCDDIWVSAVAEQLMELQHTSNLYYTGPCARLAQLLCERTGMSKVFFSNSGAEANECAIKVARKYAADKYGKERNVILTLKNSFHGRTITTLSATGQDVFHNDFLPLTEGFQYVEANNISDLEDKVKSGNVAAIMFELVQGEGGVMPLTQEFVNRIFELSEEYDLITIADEVQTGNGRTGQLYAYMNYGVKPDIFSTAKGLGGGLPLGATVLSYKVADVLGAGDHGSTFGGNPVCCAGAISILNRLDDELLADVRKKSEYIISELSACSGVTAVDGMGLMLGVTTVKPADEIVKECMDRGVLVIKAKHKVRLLPALNIDWETLKEAIEIIKAVCSAEV